MPRSERDLPLLVRGDDMWMALRALMADLCDDYAESAAKMVEAGKLGDYDSIAANRKYRAGKDQKAVMRVAELMWGDIDSDIGNILYRAGKAQAEERGS